MNEKRVKKNAKNIVSSVLTRLVKSKGSNMKSSNSSKKNTLKKKSVKTKVTSKKVKSKVKPKDSKSSKLKKEKVVKTKEPVPVLKKKKIYNIPINKKTITLVISESVGEDALDIVFYLKGKKDVSEFKIADDTGIEIHAVRNILYRLNNEGAVSYIRKKDKEKGWYISYWTFLINKIPEQLYRLKEIKLERFKERIEKEELNKGNFYLCPSGCVRMDFDTAMDANFRCPECGHLLNQQDNSRTIETLKENISNLEKELKEYKII